MHTRILRGAYVVSNHNPRWTPKTHMLSCFYIALGPDYYIPPQNIPEQSLLIGLGLGLTIFASHTITLNHGVE